MIAFHGTRAMGAVLREGLRASASKLCHHVCFAERPELAANFGPVLVVDVAGLPVVWEKGERRIHGDVAVERIIGIYWAAEPGSWEGWEDPALRHNHRACLDYFRDSRSHK